MMVQEGPFGIGLRAFPKDASSGVPTSLGRNQWHSRVCLRGTVRMGKIIDRVSISCRQYAVVLEPRSTSTVLRVVPELSGGRKRSSAYHGRVLEEPPKDCFIPAAAAASAVVLIVQ